MVSSPASPDRNDKKSYEKNKIYLQNYFNRDELYFIMTRSKQNNINRIIQERLSLAQLLLSDNVMTMDNLLAKFEFHREYDYAHKKRIKDGIKEWISYPGKYVADENKIIFFFQKLNKLKG